MNKPILFIDEKPFEEGDKIAKSAFQLLKSHLTASNLLENVEFFFEQNEEFPFKFDSSDFSRVVKDRKLIFIHNSHPHTKDKTLFSLEVVNKMKTILQGKSTVVKFSGQIYRRGYDDDEVLKLGKENLKIGQQLRESDLMIERDDLYNYFEIFMREWVKFPHCPNYFILKYGVDAPIKRAEEIKHRMTNCIWEDYHSHSTSLASALNKTNEIHKGPQRRLKNNWKNIVATDYLEICSIAGYDQERKSKASKFVESNQITYVKYFEIVSKIIKEINPLNL